MENPLIDDLLYNPSPSPSPTHSLRAGIVKRYEWAPGQTIKIKFLRENKHSVYKNNDNPNDKRTHYSELEAEVKTAINEWGKYVNLNFVYLDYNDSKDGDINIGFMHSADSDPAGSHSFIGTDCKSQRVSINFGWRKYSTYLHELGHALGLKHEHQLPNHDIEWDMDLAYKYFKASQGWDKKKVDDNLNNTLKTKEFTYSEPDPKSIMCYFIPKELIKKGDVEAFQHNEVLSDIDKKFISFMYPDYELKSGAELNMLMKNSTNSKAADQTITKIVYGLKKDYSSVIRFGTRRGSADADNSIRTGVYVYNNAAYILVDSVKTFIPDCTDMFRGFENVESIDIRELNTIASISMDAMFMNCYKLKSLDLSKLNTGQVISMDSMFWKCESLKTLNISTFYTKNCTNMFSMFGHCSSLGNIVFPTRMSSESLESVAQMFLNCRALTELKFPNDFRIENVKSTSNMFRHCSSLTSLDVTHFNTSNVTLMTGMFYDCSSLTRLDIRNFKTANVKTFDYMFNGCKKLNTLEHYLETKKATTLGYMFKDCSSMGTIIVDTFDTSKVKTMKEMFMNCKQLGGVNMSNFNMTAVEDMESMFSGCTSLTALTVSKTFYPKQATMSIAIQLGIYKGCPIRIVIK